MGYSIATQEGPDSVFVVLLNPNDDVVCIMGTGENLEEAKDLAATIHEDISAQEDTPDRPEDVVVDG